LFVDVPKAPNDAIFGINIAFDACEDPEKLNLGVGAYRDEQGKPYLLPVVLKVEHEMLEVPEVDKEYLPINGLFEFNTASQKVIFGDVDDTVASLQSVGGTGALRLAAEFAGKYSSGPRKAYVSNPTWSNHFQVLRAAGYETGEYRYYSPETNGLDKQGMLEDLEGAPSGSLIVLHTCAHNPTGVDPSKEQWEEILNLILNKNHLVLFDTAYQGYATGDLEADAYAIRLAKKMGMMFMVAQSYSKNMGFYGERVGCVHIVCRSKEMAVAVTSQVKLFVRAMYSNPPKHGAYVAQRIIHDDALFSEWKEELKLMSGRIIKMRELLFDALAELGTKGNWDHIKNQIGMFTFTGLTKDQVKVMTDKHHIFMLPNGRISMPGLTTETVPKLAAAIHDVVMNYD